MGRGALPQVALSFASIDPEQQYSKLSGPRTLDLYRDPFVFVGAFDVRAVLLFKAALAAFPGMVPPFDVAVSITAARGVFRAVVFGDGVAEGSSSISNPNSAEISSSSSNLAASGRALTSGRSLFRFATNSFWFTALNWNNSSGC